MSHIYNDGYYGVYHDYSHDHYASHRVPLQIVTGSDASAVPLYEAKEFFREDRDTEDAVINSLINASIKSIENYTGYKLLNTVYRLHLHSFFDVFIPKKPFQSNSVTVYYDDENGSEQTLSSSEYTVYDFEDPVRVEFHGDNLPTLDDDDNNDYPVRVEFTIGYGTEHTAIPQDWKTAIKLLAMVYFRRDIPKGERENIDPLNMSIISSLLSDYRIGRFK